MAEAVPCPSFAAFGQSASDLTWLISSAVQVAKPVPEKTMLRGMKNSIVSTVFWLSGLTVKARVIFAFFGFFLVPPLLGVTLPVSLTSSGAGWATATAVM